MKKITIKAKRLDSFFEKSKGLIGKGKSEIITFDTRFGIHTFFLESQIDVAIFDDNCKVVKIKKGLKPNKFFMWNPRYKSIIEMPNGTIEKKKIIIGSKITLDQ